ncbi:hypothetical protein EQG49_10020 [Periweissella cryptocerci]|uniref:Uncharacterized protein n=1 Tax=Periweissella cryptocerci TaxID=2506420 RepID=A0A4P6YVH3_9LACO|nr:hypothetical protein [Periweissella cryptocerci]QBO36771.1 hypothetical protein EQG49_10020 [Periweissella cryptocerci]
MKVNIFDSERTATYVDIKDNSHKQLTLMNFTIDGVTYPQLNGNRVGNEVAKGYSLVFRTQPHGEVSINGSSVTLKDEKGIEFDAFTTADLVSVEIGIFKTLGHSGFGGPQNKYWTFVYFELADKEYYFVNLATDLSLKLLNSDLFNGIKVVDSLNLKAIEGSLNELELTKIFNAQYEQMIVGTEYPKFMKMLGTAM